MSRRRWKFYFAGVLVGFLWVFIRGVGSSQKGFCWNYNRWCSNPDWAGRYSAWSAVNQQGSNGIFLCRDGFGGRDHEGHLFSKCFRVW